MALSYPYPIDFLAKCLVGPEVPLTLRRFDEMSGSGDGRFWSAQLAPPLWTASYQLYSRSAAEAREINAKIHALDGAAKTLVWCDPYYRGPAANVSAGLSGVTVSGIRADRCAVSLAGVPDGFFVTTGDYLSINFGARRYFGQFAEAGTEAGLGIPMTELRPALPLGISTGATVELVKPRFNAIVTDFQPFTSFRGRWGQNAAITILQKR